MLLCVMLYLKKNVTEQKGLSRKENSQTISLLLVQLFWRTDPQDNCWWC